MNKKRIPIISIMLYVLSSLLLIYTLWSFYHNYSYISEMVDMGQLFFKGNEYDIISFYMVNSVQYFIFAVVIVTLGWLVQLISNLGYMKHQIRKGMVTKVGEGVEEEGFEEWFNNNDD